MLSSQYCAPFSSECINLMEGFQIRAFLDFGPELSCEANETNVKIERHKKYFIEEKALGLPG